MKLAIVGSRSFKNKALVQAFVRSLPRDTEIISGGAEGPDTWAIEEARALHMDTWVFYPDKVRYKGKSALFARNREVAYESDAGVGFWVGASGGTLDTARCFNSLGKKFVLVGEEDELPSLDDLSTLKL